MRIYGDQISGVYGQNTAAARRVGMGGIGSASGTNANNADLGLDRVDVSPLAETMSNVLSAYYTARNAQVDQIATMVQAGKYTVDAGAVADAITTEMYDGSVA